MNGWAWAGLAIAVQAAAIPLLSYVLRHGERQPRAGRHAPVHRPSWAHTAPSRRRMRRHRR